MPYRFQALLGAALFIVGGLAWAADNAPPQPPAAAKTTAKAPHPKLVDINSAGRAELKTLPGIGDAEADRIIANRPYLTKSHLVTKKVLELGPYDALRGRIIAVQPEPTKARS